jgi:hypothetical protein
LTDLTALSSYLEKKPLLLGGEFAALMPRRGLANIFYVDYETPLESHAKELVSNLRAYSDRMRQRYY